MTDAPFNPYSLTPASAEGQGPDAWRLPPARRPGRGAVGSRWQVAFWGLMAILTLALMAAAVGWIWQSAARLDARTAESARMIEAARQSLTASAGIEGKVTTSLSSVDRRFDTQAAELSRLAEAEGHTRNDINRLAGRVEATQRQMTLRAVEELLATADARLKLVRDLPGALATIAQADARLAADDTNDWLALRSALAADRLRLQSVHHADEIGAALEIGALADKVQELPLRAERPLDDMTSPPPTAGTGFWSRLRLTLAQVFILRREASPLTRALPLEQQQTARLLLMMRLENARTALLRGEPVVYRQSVQQSLDWLDSQFLAIDQGVIATRINLLKLATLDFDRRLPELTQSRALVATELRDANRAALEPGPATIGGPNARPTVATPAGAGAGVSNPVPVPSTGAAH